MTLKFLGVFVHKLPKVPLTEQVYQHECKDCSTDKIKRVSWFAIYRNTKFEISAKHTKKTKRTELNFGKSNAVLKGFAFCEPGTPDLPLQAAAGETEWKVMLRQDSVRKVLVLFINDQAFAALPV